VIGINKTSDMDSTILKRIKDLIEINDKTSYGQQEIIYY